MSRTPQKYYHFERQPIPRAWEGVVCARASLWPFVRERSVQICSRPHPRTGFRAWEGVVCARASLWRVVRGRCVRICSRCHPRWTPVRGTACFAHEPRFGVLSVSVACEYAHVLIRGLAFVRGKALFAHEPRFGRLSVSVACKYAHGLIRWVASVRETACFAREPSFGRLSVSVSG